MLCDRHESTTGIPSDSGELRVILTAWAYLLRFLGRGVGRFALHPAELLRRYAWYTPSGIVRIIWATLTDQNSISGGWNESMGT